MEQHIWLVQIGKDKGSYRTKYEFKSSDLHCSQAYFYFNSTNVHSGYKKRLVCDGKVIARVLS